MTDAWADALAGIALVGTAVAIRVAVRSNGIAQRALNATETATVIETARRHEELEPVIAVAMNTIDYTLSITFEGPVGLDYLDRVVVQFDDLGERAPDADVAVWGPMCFVSEIAGSGALGSSSVAMEWLERGASKQWQIMPTTPPDVDHPETATERSSRNHRWSRQFTDQSIPVTVRCFVTGYRPWTAHVRLVGAVNERWRRGSTGRR